MVSPLFKPMIRSSFNLSGYYDERLIFQNVLQICFTYDNSKKLCEILNCNNSIFIKCSYCRTHLCFKCFKMLKMLVWSPESK